MGVWNEVNCRFKGERAEELFKVIETIYRNECAISAADEYAPDLLPAKVLNTLGNGVVFVNDLEFWEDEKVAYVVFDDTALHLEFYLELAKAYNLELYMRAAAGIDEIYINTDDTGKYLPEKYYFNIYADFLTEKTQLLETLERILRIYGSYFPSFEPFRMHLKEYGIETEEDMYALRSYLLNAYPAIAVYFGRFVNPYRKGKEK